MRTPPCEAAFQVELQQLHKGRQQPLEACSFTAHQTGAESIHVKLARIISARFSLDEGTDMRFCYNPAVYAFLLAAAATVRPTPSPHTRFIAPESGHLHYAPGECYRTGLAFLPHANPGASGWQSTLQRRRRETGHSRPPLGPDAVPRENRDGRRDDRLTRASEASWLNLNRLPMLRKRLPRKSMGGGGKLVPGAGT